MILKQFYLGCLAHASYFIGDLKTKTAIIVDPQRDIQQYLEEAKQHQLKIEHVFLTHFHADFLAGHLELRDKTGAKIYLGAKADADYEFTSVKEGEVLKFGSIEIKILETPGHTPEGISLVVYDLEKDSKSPHAVLTGDTLFIGDVGRPDLMASIGITAQELGEMLYDSLHEKLLKLPDETIVYPAHGAGSMCGKNLSSETSSTMGTQRKLNYALQPMSKEAFVKLVTADQPQAPAYFPYDAILNRKEHSNLEENLKTALHPLELSEVIKLKEKEDAQLVDVRSSDEFSLAHFKGSLNITLEGKFATWSGTLLDVNRPIVLIGKPGQEKEATIRLGRIGFDQVKGYLANSLTALEKSPELVGKTERTNPKELLEQIATQKPAIIDVRTPNEWNKCHIDGSINIPLNQLATKLSEVPKAEKVVVYCQTGQRSSTAISLLKKHNFDNIIDLVGGLEGWKNSGLEASIVS